jgi:hypothetical protein
MVLLTYCILNIKYIKFNFTKNITYIGRNRLLPEIKIKIKA